MTDIEDRDCNTCEHFDPMTGMCSVYRTEVDPCNDPCEHWRDWDEPITIPYVEYEKTLKERGIL